MLAQAGRRQRARPPVVGSLVGGPIFEFYELRKTWARTWMLKDENLYDGHKGSFGPRKNSFRGVFDVPRWRDYIGLTNLEYEAFEKACRLYRSGEDPAIKIAVLDKILTNLGRPELFAQWYGDQPFRGEEEDDEDDELALIA